MHQPMRLLTSGLVSALLVGLMVAPGFAAGDNAKGMGMTLAKANNVIGKNIKNGQGEEIGEVEDLVIDWDSGEVTYAVISIGGFLGMGEELFAVPYKALKPGSEADTYVLNLDKAKLKAAPHFTKSEWPDLKDLEYWTRVHEYYGQVPPWKQRVSPSASPQAKEREREK